MSTETTFENNFFLDDEEYSFLKKNRDPVIKWILFFIASIATIFVFLIIVYLFMIGGPFFAEVSLDEFLLGTNWLPSNDEYGALPIIVDTLLVTFGAIIIALPFGLMTAIFIAELAPPKLRKFLKFSVEILAGIPSVVFGFFGLRGKDFSSGTKLHGQEHGREDNQRKDQYRRRSLPSGDERHALRL